MALVAAGMLVSSAALADGPRRHQQEREHGRERGNPHREDYYREDGDNRGDDRYERPHRERGHWKEHGNPHRGRVVEVYDSPSRDKRYHPKWHPHHDFARRWVYFPRYNMYWDNYREMYVYSSCGRWVAEPEPPRIAINVNLSSERFVELGVDLDARSDAFVLNSRHRIVFKL